MQMNNFEYIQNYPQNYNIKIKILMLQQHNEKEKQSSLAYIQTSYTNINELIAQIEPLEQKSYSYTQMFKSLLKLSSYLFSKKQLQIESQSFDEYLNSFHGVNYTRRQQFAEDQQDNYTVQSKPTKSSRNKKIQILPQTSLIKCYEKVPYIYFQSNFVIDFHLFSEQEQLQQLNDHLDLVQLNLFTQIHRKFHEYFKVVSNLDYLRQSISKNIKSVQETRVCIKRCKVQFVDKSNCLRKLIIQRQNIEKTCKSMKLIKSFKKLPSIIESILKTSLPYQCLQLLQSTKQSLSKMKGLTCLTKIQQIIRNCESTIQINLNRRYIDQLYLYLLSQCQQINFRQKWSRINLNKCLDTSVNMSGFVDNDNSAILQTSMLDNDAKQIVLKRQEGKQFEIAMLILQSYRFIQFPVDQGRIKICNFLRVFAKVFEKQLGSYFIEVIKNKNTDNQVNILSQQQNSQQQQNIQKQSPKTPSKDFESQSLLTQQTVRKFSVDYYVKHLKLLNQAFREIINRYLGYIHTLVIQYQKNIKKGIYSEEDQKKFQNFFLQQFSLLPAIYKLATEKIQALLTMKNLRGTPYLQFYQWLQTISFWQKYLQSILEDHPLSTSYEGFLIDKIDLIFKKCLIIAKQQKQLSHQLTVNYINLYHENVLYNELKPTIEDDSWQSVEIPRAFQDIILGIILGKNPAQNMSNVSVTILNDSGYKPLQKQHLQTKKQQPLKIKLLKNVLLFEGHRYKVSVSMLLLCEYIDQYLKMSRLFSQEKELILTKLIQLISYYNKITNRLILKAQALKLQNVKIKSKSINAKHMCLLSNCISVIQMLIKQIPNLPNIESLWEQLSAHKQQIHKKLSHILVNKIQVTINSFSSPTPITLQKSNQAITAALAQMYQVVDDYLNPQQCKFIFNEPMQIFMQKFFTYMILKGQPGQSEAKIALQKLNFMKIKFEGQFKSMQKEIIK